MWKCGERYFIHPFHCRPEPGEGSAVVLRFLRRAFYSASFEFAFFIKYTPTPANAIMPPDKANSLL